MTRYSAIAVILMSMGTASVSLQAQSTPTPKTPAECLSALQAHAKQLYEQAQASNTPLDRKSFRADMLGRARSCAANFNLNTIDQSQLEQLGMLYLVAENPSAARQAFKRVIDDTSATSAERAKTILMAMQGFMRNEGDSGVAVAESYLPTLDALPDVVVPRFQARQLLLGWYLNYDIDDKILVTAPYMLQLAKSMTAAEQQQNVQAITMAYQAMASYQANRLHPDSALAILHQAPTDFPTLASLLTQGLASTVTRYEMIGKKVPALHADYWINKEAKFPAGNASILLFTANWCHSCRDSYPTVVKLNDELKSKGLQTVLAVTLDGVFEGKAMTPDEEVEANRKYFVGEHKFTFPIAVQRPREGSASGEGNVQAFEVGAYPDFVVVDKTGIVRAVLLGWDPYGNRAKALTTVLNQLL